MDVTVEEFTSPNPLTINLNAELREALQLMNDHRIRHLPVVEDNKVLGIISDRDIYANLDKNWSEPLRVKNIMSTSLLIVRTNDGLGEVAYQLSKNKKGSAIVIDQDNKLYGIFTTTDALNALVEFLIPEAKEKSMFKVI